MSYIEELLEWRDIEGYEGLYKVSEYGDIMSLKYGKKKILKQISHRDGYLKVNLCKDGQMKTYFIHRLVATAFCEGAGEFPVVNHRDENKANNHYTNLEWCTHEYNTTYGSLSEKNASNGLKERRGVRCIELDMTFESILKASRYVDGDPSKISKCCRGYNNRHTHKGYHWEYVD
jgi:hypothetical protein